MGVHVDAALARLVEVARRHGVARRTSRRCRRRRSGPPRSPTAPGVIPPCTTPHMPGTSASEYAFITWQVDVPITASIWPGSIARAAGAVTCASTLPTATAMPSGSPVHPAASAVSAAGARAEVGQRVLDLVLDEAGEALVERRQVLARGVAAVLVDRLVARRAGVAGLPAAQLPHDPVGGLDPAVRAGERLRVLLEHLQRLGELPLGGDAPAVARQPRLAALGGHRVDAIRLTLGGVVLPQLHVRVRAVLEAVHPAQRRPVAQHRHGRRGREVRADADHVGRRDAGRRDRGRHRFPENVEVVLGVLQRPVRG